MEKLYGVIGNPIAHSMSPAMHNDLFHFYGIDAHYHALLVKEEYLKEAVMGLKAIGISGFNVTVPHKVAIIPHLDRVDDLAASIGAVNTVVNENGKFVGYNTDGAGFVEGLKLEVNDISDKQILIIGAGGASRAVYFTLAQEGAGYIDIANRTVSRAKQLKDDCPFPVKTEAIDLRKAESKLDQYDIIIQTTNVGMKPDMERIPLSLNRLSRNTIVCDLIYNPLETKFLRTAKMKGAKIQNGMKMFVFQGALAFEKWTGIFPDINRMRKNVECLLGGTSC